MLGWGIIGFVFLILLVICIIGHDSADYLEYIKINKEE